MNPGVYLEYLRISFQNMLAYRARYYVGVFTYIFHVAVYYFIFKSIYADESVIREFSLDQMLTYISVGWISKSFYMNNIDREMAADVKSGQIAMTLVKPINLQMMVFAQGVGQSLFRLVLFTPPVIITTVLLFDVQWPSSVGYFVIFIISTLLSACIYMGINFLIGLLAVYFLSIQQILYSKNLVIELFSGLLIPISWFPEWFQTLSAALPFQSIAYVPLSIYLGKLEGTALNQALGLQLVWAIGLLGLGHLIWLHCQRKMLIQGG